jgi:hypothetical protein
MRNQGRPIMRHLLKWAYQPTGREWRGPSWPTMARAGDMLVSKFLLIWGLELAGDVLIQLIP